MSSGNFLKSPTTEQRQFLFFSARLIRLSSQNITVILLILVQLISLSEAYDYVTTFVGTGAATSANDPGLYQPVTSVILNKPTMLWADLLGNRYIVEQSGVKVRKVDVNAQEYASTIIGTGSISSNVFTANGDGGQATSATLKDIISIVGDNSSGVLYLAEMGTNRVRKMTVDGILTTMVGNNGPTTGLTYDGVTLSGTSTSINNPRTICMDGTGIIYFTENGGKKVRSISADFSSITTVAGPPGSTVVTASASDATSGLIGDGGAATSASFSAPDQIFMFPNDNNRLYIADRTIARLRLLEISTGIISTIAGNSATTAASFEVNAVPATSCSLSFLSGVNGDSLGNLYLVTFNDHRVRKMTTPGMMITIFAGDGAAVTPNTALAGDGGAVSAATFNKPQYSFIDSSGNLYISEPERGKIRYIYNPAPTQMPTTIAPSVPPSVSPTPGPTVFTVHFDSLMTVMGDGTEGATVGGGVAADVQVMGPEGVWGNSFGDIFIADTKGHTISRIVASTSVVTVIAGSGTAGHQGDGSVASGGGSQLSNPTQIYGDTIGNLYVADRSNFAIRVIHLLSGVINLVAGDYVTDGETGDGGSATSATLRDPRGVWIDSGVGNIYITTSDYGTIRRVASNGIIYLYGGAVPYDIDFAGDGGPATSAKFNNLGQLWGDSMHKLYLCDESNNKVRMIDLGTSVVTTVAGTLIGGVDVEGPGTTTVLNNPCGVFGDTNGNLFIAETGTGHRIKRLSADGILSTIAGSGSASVSAIAANGDGPLVSLTSATFNSPHGIYFDRSYQLYVTDTLNQKVRKLFDGDMPSYSPTSQPSSNPSRQPVMRPSCQPTTQPLSMPSRQPSMQPTCQPSRQPFMRPSSRPSNQPIAVPTVQPSGQPSTRPSVQPSQQPSLQPSIQPSSHPTCQPSSQPTLQPSIRPSIQPTTQPSDIPSEQPSHQPSSLPSVQPSSQPSVQPIALPSAQPSRIPTTIPSEQPSSQPTRIPTVFITAAPSVQPSSQPSGNPSTRPSLQPSLQPSIQPSSCPSRLPSSQPIALPSCMPTLEPSSRPSSHPTIPPSNWPSKQPVASPSRQPSSTPSSYPTIWPSIQPSMQPSHRPSSGPSSQPSRQPSRYPTSQPASHPSSFPSGQPSTMPSVQPSRRPSLQPMSRPSSQPNVSPSCQPSRQPTRQPSGQPIGQPTSQPSRQPFSVPTSTPTCDPTRSPVAKGVIRTSRPTVLPTFRPTALPTFNPTFDPTWAPTVGILPSRDDIYVHYIGVNMTRFKIVLPFLFTEPMFGDGFENITLTPPTDGNSYMLLGSNAYESNKMTVENLPNGKMAIAYDYTARSVSIAGDVNGDGYEDLIIGVPYDSVCYLMYGTKRGFVNMTEGFTILGVDSSDLTGWSASAAGDVNNDTFADIIIGAPNAAVEGTGSAYVLYGGSGTMVVFLDQLTSSQGYAIHGVDAHDCFGISVSGAGDVNGDGYDDIVVGALRVGSSFAGAFTVVYGHAARQTSSLYVSTMLATQGYTINGQSYSWLGYSVSGAGDVNGDGVDDIIVGSTPRRIITGIQVSYLLYGNRNMSVRSVSSMSASQGVVITGGGVVVSGVGDLNGDGFDEVAVGANFDFDSGAGFVVYIPNTIPYSSARPTLMPTSLGPTLAPSAPPSVRPTFAPSVLPTRAPTQPTVQPSLAPTGPTLLPSVAPTQPSSIPSAVPTAPSLAPSAMPTLEPTESPTMIPSESPSHSPSTAPSAAPSYASTLPPITLEPSHIPTMLPTFMPSRFPVVRPTPSSAIPTIFNTTTPRIPVKITSEGGVFARGTGGANSNYVINSTQSVIVVITGSGNGDMFTLLPTASFTLIVGKFNISGDVLNLESFNNIHSVDDLNITDYTESTHWRKLSDGDRVEGDKGLADERILASLQSRGIAIHLGPSQQVVLPNNTREDIQHMNFIFTPLDLILLLSDNGDSIIFNVTVGVSCGLLFMLMLYKAIEFWYGRLSYLKSKSQPIPWDEIKRTNKTYTHFVRDVSSSSMDSDSIKTRSDGGDSSDEYKSDTDSTRDNDNNNDGEDINRNKPKYVNKLGQARRSIHDEGGQDREDSLQTVSDSEFGFDSDMGSLNFSELERQQELSSPTQSLQSCDDTGASGERHFYSHVSSNTTNSTAYTTALKNKLHQKQRVADLQIQSKESFQRYSQLNNLVGSNDMTLLEHKAEHVVDTHIWSEYATRPADGQHEECGGDMESYYGNYVNELQQHIQYQQGLSSDTQNWQQRQYLNQQQPRQQQQQQQQQQHQTYEQQQYLSHPLNYPAVLPEATDQQTLWSEYLASRSGEDAQLLPIHSLRKTSGSYSVNSADLSDFMVKSIGEDDDDDSMV